METSRTARLTPKELAAALGRSRTYVYAMRAQGFRMPGNMATLQQALDWLERRPRFRTTAYCRTDRPPPQSNRGPNRQN